MLFTVWNHQITMITGHTYQSYISKVRTLRTYAFYSLDLSILCYFQHGYIKLTFFNNMDPLNLCCLQNGPIKLMLCSNGNIKLMMFTVWLSFYMIKPIQLRCCQYGPIQPFVQPYTRNNITSVIVTILFTVLSVCPINTSYTQIIYKTSNKNWICQHCYVVLNITLNTFPLLLAKCNYNSSWLE